MRGVEIAGRFVREENRRIDRKRAGDRDALTLAAGKFFRQMLQPVAELHQVEQLPGALFDLAAATSRAGAAAGRRFRGTSASAAG